MVHNLMQLWTSWQEGECEIHGKSSKACAAATEIATVGAAATLLGGLGWAAARGPGAVLGTFMGIGLGAWLNSLDKPVHSRGR